MGGRRKSPREHDDLETRHGTLPGVRVRSEAGRFLASGGHIPAEAPLADDLELIDEERFTLLGRLADVVNIAGKRTSLAHLTATLLEVPGVRDCAFLLPAEEGRRVARLTAFVVAPDLSREEILRALRERIDPVFLPRPLHRVAALPRNATGKLPYEALLQLARDLKREA